MTDAVRTTSFINILLTGRDKEFPSIAVRVGAPELVLPCIATGNAIFCQYAESRLAQPVEALFQIIMRIQLDSKVAFREHVVWKFIDGEVDRRLVNIILGLPFFHPDWIRIEDMPIEIGGFP